MAPAKPTTYTAGSHPVSKFEGAFVVTKHTPPKDRNIYFHVRIDPNHPRLLALQAAGKKPPTHFHPRQWEYFKVERGSLTVEIDGVPHDFTAADGEYALRPGPHHCLYGTPGQAPGTAVEFWLSASPSGVAGELDQAFFENWYAYQEEVMLRGAAPDPIQVLSMFDAGDSYLSPPAWVPFRRFFGRALGVVVGRHVGGLLGYAPFLPEWTTDWDAACRKMSLHWTQRRFAVPGLQKERRAEYLGRGQSIGNEALYEELGGYENWVAKKTK
ncbi:hypothetical protein INS49_000081 [Diaporthe citri]|uniref:uncharacterized protein n=1 Tax=Diaporthe citri TaxID=83186 RepID=UPI001C81F5AE|nr:uncharacterized protein INS49_000081 [Diaporthe citri]KAG6365905.1 hypothetical protein INS49_000081 [Diaporthe citri]